jgi:hypothetical protein
MKLKTPLITLVAGLLVAGVLYVVNTGLTRETANADPAAVASATSTEPSPQAEPSPTIGDGSGPAAEGQTITYAGWVDGGGASLAVVVSNGKALAYVCDGATVEAWLEGTMANGLIELTGADGSLTGTYGNGQVTGDVTAVNKSWHFTIATAEPPSGAYRSAAGLRDQLDASWVVLPDGTQVGVERTGGTRRAAAPFDLTTGTASVGGASVAVEPIEP